MRRMITAFVALMALCLGAPAAIGAAAGTAPQGSIAMQINCIPQANTMQIFNNTNAVLDLQTWTVTSLYRPGPDAPIALNGTVAPGGGATFFVGASKTRILIGHDLFKPDQPGESARLASPYGTLDVLCSAGRGTLTLGAPAPTLTITPAGGPCGRDVTLGGAQFSPGDRVTLRGPRDAATNSRLATYRELAANVAADGRWAITTPFCAAGDGTWALAETEDRSCLVPSPPCSEYVYEVASLPDPAAPPRPGSGFEQGVRVRITRAAPPGLPNTGGGGMAGR